MPYAFNDDKSKWDFSNEDLISSVINQMSNQLYPVGSIYISAEDDFDPNEVFSGTWTKIEDKFLLGTGSSNLSAKQTGGQSSITLTESQCALPEHSHAAVTKNNSTYSITASASSHKHPLASGVAVHPGESQTKVDGNAITTYLAKQAYAQSNTMVIWNSNRRKGNTKTKDPLYTNDATPTVSVSGRTALANKASANSPVTIMPPYYTVHIWRRDE